MQASKDPIDFSRSILREQVKEVLEQLVIEGGHGSLTIEVCKGLLLDSPPPPPTGVSDPPPDEIQPQNFKGGLAILSGYPEYPLYHRLSDSLAYWIITGICPVFELPKMYMLNEDTAMLERRQNLETHGDRLSSVHGLWDCWSHDEQNHSITSVLKDIDLRGVLDLLGIRCTAGSHSILPPPKETLLESFTKRHHPSAKISVGGRALSKHSDRDDSLQWWGKCTGSEEGKNSHALKICLRVMRDATWINIHTLPHDLRVIEIRTIEGYGVRWLHDGSEFRGFLEPQMEGGHLVGWRH